ncbi:MAG: hypothetical protein HY547_04895 [Elusimicrobia bacterium]|nr:hypothetical protein [Elusimicrobiota bacterium]
MLAFILLAAFPVCGQEFSISGFAALIEATTKQAYLTQQRFNHTRDFMCAKPKDACAEGLNLTAREYGWLAAHVHNINDYVRPLEESQALEDYSTSDQKALRFKFAQLLAGLSMNITGMDYMLALRSSNRRRQEKLAPAQENIYLAEINFRAVLGPFRDRAMRIYRRLPPPFEDSESPAPEELKFLEQWR